MMMFQESRKLHVTLPNYTSMASTAKAYAEKQETFFMDTPDLESQNVESAFTEILGQIYHLVSRKVIEIGDDLAALPKEQTINVGSKDDVSAVKKIGLLLDLTTQALA
ncbi:hypothetical protein AgCh_007640 [Apium graveolens]